MSGHGFGIGPGVGRVMADLIAGRPAGHDLGRFRLGRFAGPVAVDFGAAL
jgi:glycine/D-amino acid oxidase-like deaminating enzyme